jgi:hypothetical protein
VAVFQVDVFQLWFISTKEILRVADKEIPVLLKRKDNSGSTLFGKQGKAVSQATECFTDTSVDK